MQYLLGGADLNYVGHRACLHKSSEVARKQRDKKDLEELYIWKVVAVVQEMQSLHRAISNGVWLTAMPNSSICMKLYQEEL